jgi:2-oxoglutarate dehydrogenase E2 component (dihydrolipoamide succinyltransferase)
MSIPIKVPSLGESVVEATVGQVLKPTGSIVAQDAELLELETDKVNQVLYAPAAGKVTLNVKSGDLVKVGQTIGTVDPSQAGAAPTPVKAAPKPEEKKAAPPPSAPTSLPPARKMADEFLQERERPAMPAHPKNDAFSGAPPPSLHPKDAASLGTPSAPPKVVQEGRTTRKKMTKLRKVIAQKLVEVKNQTAMLTTFNEVDMSTVIAVRQREQENFQKRHGVKLGFMSFFVKACVAALQEYPDINGKIDGDDVVYCNYFDIGIAVGTEKGLFVPVLRDADKMSFADIEKKLKEYADKAKNGTITVDEMQGGTFTITNGGTYGSLLSTPILNPPQSGILGMHNIVKRPVAVEDKIEIRPMMYLALSYDHRIVDGKESIGFLVHIKKNLEEPARLLLDL